MGAYSELDIDRQYGDDPFADDEDDCATFEEDCGAEAPSAFEADEDPAMPSASGTGNVLTVEPTSTIPAQPVELPPAVPAQPADDKTDKAAADEDAKRKAHEEAEAKRKAEWEAKQEQKKEAERLALAKLEGMSDDEVLAASVKRVGDDTEKLTRRNMKECVMEHIQTLCLDNPDFARKVLHPRKSMIHCIWYINRKAKEFIEQEMKNNDIKPENGIYGGDVPDDLCYQWAVDYFNDPNAKEDEEKEEKFVAQPYRSTGASASKKSASSKGKSKGKDAKKKDEDTAKPKAKEKAKGDPEDQMSLLGVA